MAPRKKVVKSSAAKAKPAPFKPIAESQKNIGALKSLTVDPAEVEKLSELHPSQLPDTLAPHVREAVLKRITEKGIKPIPVSEAAQKDIARLSKRASRRKKGVPTVRRGAGGKIESVRTPIAPTGDTPVVTKPDSRFAAPAPKPRKGRTRSGKKLDKVTGKVLKPTVKRGEGGKIEALSEEEKKAAVTTTLPAAGPDVMQPKAAEPVMVPRGVMQKGGLGRKAKGGKVAFPEIQKAVSAAIFHLNNAHQAIKSGLDPAEHFQTFDAIHSNIAGMDTQLHQSLAVAKHEIGISGGKTSPFLKQAHINLTSRLGVLKDIHEANKQRAMAGREKNGS